jgi:dihydroorotase-like cyclic amidohydrolase
MAAQFDLVVRNGTVLDGTGSPAREADVAVQDGRIAAVGRVAGTGREEIDAKGLAVTASSTSTPTMTVRRPGISASCRRRGTASPPC